LIERLYKSPEEEGVPFKDWKGWTKFEVQLLLDCKDRFLANRPIQPKREIGDYVESEWGLLVPKRFSSLEEAMESWSKFIMRSDNPQEYAWVSGLWSSYSITPRSISLSKDNKVVKSTLDYAIIQGLVDDKVPEYLAEHIGANDADKRNEIKRVIDSYWDIPNEEWIRRLLFFSYSDYLHLANLTNEKVSLLLKDSSFSFWEYIPWINHSVIADKDILDRYYIFSKERYSSVEWEFLYQDAITVQWWEIIKEWWFYSKSTINSTEDINILNRRIFDYKAIIDMYIYVKNLDHFDKNHTPIMEIQTSRENQEVYFLQYHRWRNTLVYKEDFVLSRKKKVRRKGGNLR